jgi:hypothetical protein
MTGIRKLIPRMGRRALLSLPAVVLVAGIGAMVPLGGAAANASPAHGRTTLTVTTTGTDTGNCQWSPCKTLGYALTQAGPGDSIVIAPGTYPESDNANVVGAALTGLSIRSAGPARRTVIDATGNTNGILIQASGVSVSGLTVENASLEGILAEPPPSTWPTGPTSPAAGISHLTIAGNIVTGNDRAYNPNGPADAECPSSPTDIDDCGEGLHLLGVSWSRVIGNDVSHNVGGILISDGGLNELSVGPAAHNLIAFNRSTDNVFDCGITLPGHDPRAVATTGPDAGQPQPSLAGVYDNRVVHNISTGNGAAGLLDATPYPGTGSYNNLFADNIASGNGNGGFVLHSHAPLQDVSGIVVVGNIFGPNNLAGDPDTGVTATTGVMLLSVAVPTSIVVTHNFIYKNVNGIAFNSNITVVGHNRFAKVTNPSFSYTPPSS